MPLPLTTVYVSYILVVKVDVMEIHGMAGKIDINGELTKMQELFAYYFVHDADGISMRAAELAGYKNPAKVASNLRKHPLIKKRIEELFSEYRLDGPTYKEVRIKQYRQMIQNILNVFATRAKNYQKMGVTPFYNPEEDADDAAIQAMKQNAWLLEHVPEESLSGMYIRKISITGGGTRIVEWVFDSAAVKELREHQKQLAIELGDWTENKNIRGDITFTSIRDLAALAEQEG